MNDSLRRDLKKLSNKNKASHFARFFKTGKGEYGEGDIFAGLTVPQCRELAIKYSNLDYRDLEDLIKSPIHEERLIGLLILVDSFEKNELEQRRIYDFYLHHTKFINNWDLVDLSAHQIVGGYLTDKPREILYKLAESKHLWERRIAIISTFEFIKNKDMTDSLRIAEILLHDEHDLIQKAVGWMLREIGKRNEKDLLSFLEKYYKEMPRTTLRYSIEKFPPKIRKEYLEGTI